MIVIPDTNFFLHYRHPIDVKWSDITDDVEVRIVVTRTIQSEIDKKKRELRGRAQKRARDFATMMHSIVSSPSGKTTLKDRKPVVTVELFRRPPGFALPPVLSDAKWGDDALVADVLAFVHEHSGENTLLLSGDSGPLLTAKEHNVPYRSLDGLDWELPPEDDERDRKIKLLEREISERKKTEPEISGSFLLPDNEKKIDVISKLHSALTDDATQQLLLELKTAHPKMAEFSLQPHVPGKTNDTWNPPDGEVVAGYHRAYDCITQEPCLLQTCCCPLPQVPA